MNDNRPRGVDLSHFNVVTDFHAIAQSGIQFVFLKATQGITFVDPTYGDRRARASSVGLRTGSYHFFDPRVSGASQAEHFLGVLGKMDALELPPALDLEETPGWDDLSIKDRIAEVGQWLRIVEESIGMRPMIYTSIGWFSEMFGDADFSGHPLWLARYASEPGDTGPWNSWTAWQYGQFGHVDGAGQGDVDTDIWSGELPSLGGQR